jgi:aminoglycoside 6-adenylyltransferase
MLLKRRNEEEMHKLILSVAQSDPRIRAVVMNGSRASPTANPDIFQDYDIVYIVTEVAPFVEDDNWIKQFGEILIMQKPDHMDGLWDKDKATFTYLMLYKDGNRLDLKLLNQSRVPNWHRDSQSLLLLDKDGLLGKYDPPSDKDYLPVQPTEKQFSDCCNEFLWVSTYVAKGICRKQLTYAKHMSEQVVKEKLIELLTWQAAILSNHEKPLGHCGKYLEKYIDPDLWEKFKKTYVDYKWENMWQALFLMFEIFDHVAKMVSRHYRYLYNEKEHRAVVEYLNSVRKNHK